MLIKFWRKLLNRWRWIVFLCYRLPAYYKFKQRLYVKRRNNSLNKAKKFLHKFRRIIKFLQNYFWKKDSLLLPNHDYIFSHLKSSLIWRTILYCFEKSKCPIIRVLKYFFRKWTSFINITCPFSIKRRKEKYFFVCMYV